MNKNKCCDHCEYQQMQDLPHKYMKELCTLELGTIHRCDVCSSSWMKSANRGWLLLREGNMQLKAAAGM